MDHTFRAFLDDFLGEGGALRPSIIVQRRVYRLERLGRVQTQCQQDHSVFGWVEATLMSLIFGYERLGLTKRHSQIDLRHALGASPFDERLNKGAIVGRVKR